MIKTPREILEKLEIKVVQIDCPNCKGETVICNEKWTEFYKQQKDAGNLEEALKFFGVNYQSQLPLEEIDCPQCFATGKVDMQIISDIPQALAELDKFYASKEKLERLDFLKVHNVISNLFQDVLEGKPSCEKSKKCFDFAMPIAKAICQKFGTPKVEVPSVGCICGPEILIKSWSYESNGKVYCGNCNKEMPEQKIQFLEPINKKEIAETLFDVENSKPALMTTRFAGHNLWIQKDEIQKKYIKLAQAIHNLILEKQK